MERNLTHILSQAVNAPLLLEPAYARVFFCALGREIGARQVAIPQQSEALGLAGMDAVTDGFMSGGKPQARFYQIVDGIAVLPVSGTLVHKLGGMRPFSGMTGYDGILARLQQAVSDPDVKGIMLDIDSPGGQADGAFDCADMIFRLQKEKPVWALMNDQACSAAMLLAAACSRRLITQSATAGSIGVVMAHTSYAGQLKQEGIDITLVYSGGHKVDLNPFNALPDTVRADYQQRMDDARQMFAEKVALYTGLSVDAVLATEAAVYDGQAAVDAGLADQIVNSADAIAVMAAAINQKPTGGNMPELTAVEAATQENQRVMGIINCPEAKGREALASVLASQPGMSLTLAQSILSVAPLVNKEAEVSEADKIMSCDAAKGREVLAKALAGSPGMTLENALPILTAAPASPSFSEQVLALDEAKGRGALATKLAEQPGMTLDTARELLSAAPGHNATSGASAFEQFMLQNSPAAVTAGAVTGANTEESMMMSIPGTNFAESGVKK